MPPGFPPYPSQYTGPPQYPVYPASYFTSHPAPLPPLSAFPPPYPTSLQYQQQQQQYFHRDSNPLTFDRLEYCHESASLVTVTFPADMANELSVLWAEIANLKVDHLKSSIKTVNTVLNNNLKTSGLKQDLVERLQNESRTLYAQRDQNGRFQSFRNIIRTVRDPPMPPALAPPAAYYPPPPQASGSGYGAPYNPHAGLPAPRFAQGGYNAAASPGGAAGQTIRFRSSPFWRIEKQVGQVAPLVRAAQGDRKQALFNFMLSDEQRALLVAAKTSPASPQYQVRLFSCSEDFYNPARPYDHPAGAPIDFPATCEIKLNHQPVTANTKGIKKQVGTAPPVDLSRVGNGSALSLAPGVVNKVEVVYVNSEKKYFMAAFMVEVTGVKQVVDKIKKGKFRSKEDVIASIIKQNSDPDVVATAYGLSLKDPLVGSRIKTPIRSTECSHIGCFDAEVFFLMNEQTPAWACPICSKTLRVDQITVDGYFDNILKVCPSSVESVTVEPDGTWRSSDDQHGTAAPKGPSAPASAAPSRSASAALPPPMANGKGKQRASEALTIDSDSDDDDDDDDEPQPKRKADVIDLTGDSDDEAPPTPPRRVVPPPAPGQAYRDELVAAQARRAADAEATRKRVRADLDDENDSDDPWRGGKARFE